MITPDSSGLTEDKLALLAAESYIRAALHAFEDFRRADAALAILEDYQDQMVNGALEDHTEDVSALEYAISKIAWIDEGRPE